MRLVIFMAFLAALPPSAVRAQEVVAGVASVIDGDTIEIHGTRIRLHGIDAPESSQWCDRDQIAYRCGRDAAFALAEKIGRGVVSCLQRDTDRYGRMVAICTVGCEEVNGWLVAQGYAIAYRKYSLEYVPTEDRAREAKVGVWAGEFQRPDEYRHRGRTQEAKAPGPRHACICPADVDAAGRRCGARSAFVKSGGTSPTCTGRI